MKKGKITIVVENHSLMYADLREYKYDPFIMYLISEKLFLLTMLNSVAIFQ